MVVGIFLDPYASMDQTVEEEYEELEELLTGEFPDYKFVFKRELNPYELKNNPIDIYIFDFGGLCYSDYSGQHREDLSRKILESAIEMPNTLFIPYSTMTIDYIGYALDEFFPNVTLHNFCDPDVDYEYQEYIIRFIKENL